ncbi:MAG: 50S ribosomal protein L29 [Myxococcota bacterium]|jgi:large subunit ribosomal protein L29|nr:50S ribosomal protein L29 [Myxococcota bacterium]MEC9439785.1 50S ribosomal protein L29 [Myxococcota bacterium]
MKATELREKTTTELEELERQVRDELFRLRMKHYSGQLQRPSDLQEKRRDIARIKTVLTEKRG